MAAKVCKGKSMNGVAKVIETPQKGKRAIKRLPGMQGTKARRVSVLQAHKNEHAHI